MVCASALSLARSHTRARTPVHILIFIITRSARFKDQKAQRAINITFWPAANEIIQPSANAKFTLATVLVLEICIRERCSNIHTPSSSQFNGKIMHTILTLHKEVKMLEIDNHNLECGNYF